MIEGGGRKMINGGGGGNGERERGRKFIRIATHHDLAMLAISGIDISDC